MTPPALEQVRAALATVDDPEIHKPITELGMVDAVDISEAGQVDVRILLTVVGCPMRDRLTRDVSAAVSALPGVTGVSVAFGVMDDEQRSALQTSLRGGQVAAEIPFNAAGLADEGLRGRLRQGRRRQVVGDGQPRGVDGALRTQGRHRRRRHLRPLGPRDARGRRRAADQVDDMILPVPTEDGPSVISIGMMKPSRDQVVAWRGPMLDRALVQMLTDVYWSDLDVLLLDLPPGTGDMAISLGQHLPNAEVVVVTTPQEAAAEVAERAGTMASMMQQRVVGVVENMSYLVCPHCDEAGVDHRLDVFGSGGGARVAATLSSAPRVRRTAARAGAAGHPAARRG